MTIHRAQRIPRQRGRAAWAAILGPALEYPSLSEKRTADVAVVGAGFAGLSAALRVRQLDPSLAIVVLDAGRIAEGASGRNSGFMIDLPHDLTSEDYAGSGDDGAQIRLNREAIAFAKDAVQKFQISPDYFDPSGKVNGAASVAADAHNKAYADHLASLGEPSEMLDHQSMSELTGSPYYQSGLYTPGTVILQPAGYIRALADGLAGDGVSIYENSPVLELSRNNGAWAVKTDAGEVSAARVILATNGHLESFGFAKGRLMHIFLYASMTPALDAEALAKLGGAPRWGITPSDPMGTTVRRIGKGQGGDRIVTRTVATLRSGMETSAADLKRATEIQKKKFDARFPKLAGLAPEFEWAGHLCLTRNGVSVTGGLDEGLYSACVQNGLGTVRGTLTGIAAAEMALGHESRISRHFAEEDTPTKLPPQPFRDLGANLILRWKERQAATE